MEEQLRELAARLLASAKSGCAVCPERSAGIGEDCTNYLCNLAQDIREARRLGIE